MFLKLKAATAMGIAGFFRSTVKKMASRSGVSLMQKTRVVIIVAVGLIMMKEMMDV